MVAYLLPVVGIAMGAIVLDDPITANRVGGTVLIIAGIALVNSGPARAPHRREAVRPRGAETRSRRPEAADAQRPDARRLRAPSSTTQTSAAPGHGAVPARDASASSGCAGYATRSWRGELTRDGLRWYRVRRTRSRREIVGSSRSWDHPSQLGSAAGLVGGPADELLEAAKLGLDLGCDDQALDRVVEHEIDPAARRSLHRDLAEAGPPRVRRPQRELEDLRPDVDHGSRAQCWGRYGR